MMKKGVVFINTARGGIVNTKDLMEALDNGTVSLAGLDVYENEKPIFFHNHSDKKIQDELFEKLRSYPNVLVTGHQAFLTVEALEDIATATINNIDLWSKEGKSVNDLN
jgi:D-lactate dehydrogenase